MALLLGDNLDFNKPQPNFERDYYEFLHDTVDPITGETKKGMLDVSKKKMPQMYIAFCKETGKAYLYNKDNENDPEWGYWREIPSNINLAKVATSGSYLDLLDTPIVYTKSETDTLLADKANQSTTYTKVEVDNAIPDVEHITTSDIDTLFT